MKNGSVSFPLHIKYQCENYSPEIGAMQRPARDRAGIIMQQMSYLFVAVKSQRHPQTRERKPGAREKPTDNEEEEKFAQ